MDSVKKIRSTSGSMSVEKVSPRDGRSTWRITRDGRSLTASTTVSSTAAIKKASKIYAKTLKRLADK